MQIDTRGGELEASPSVGRSLAHGLRRLGLVRVAGLWATVVGVGAAFGAANSAFVDGDNLLDLVRAASSLAIIALGQTLVIVAGELDLSVGATYALGQVTLGVLWTQQGVGVYGAIVIALVSGAAVGFFNGAVTVFGRVPSFVATLGTLNLVAGTNLLVGKAQPITPEFNFPPVDHSELSFFKAIGGSAPFGIPAQVIWLCAMALLFVLILHRSLFGFRLMAIGGNPSAARIARLPVRKYRMIAFMICGLLAALAGIIDFSFLGSASPTTSGTELTFPVFAAVIIGGASLTGGSGTVVGTLSGALLLAELSNGLSLLGVGAGYQFMFIGGITILAVAMDKWSFVGSVLARQIRESRASRRTSS